MRNMKGIYWNKIMRKMSENVQGPLWGFAAEFNTYLHSQPIWGQLLSWGQNIEH